MPETDFINIDYKNHYYLQKNLELTGHLEDIRTIKIKTCHMIHIYNHLNRTKFS